MFESYVEYKNHSTVSVKMRRDAFSIKKEDAMALINYLNDIANSAWYMNEKTNKSQLN